MTGVFETVERVGDGVVNILETGRKLIAEQMQQGKVDLIGAVRIGGVNGRLNVGGVIE